MHRYAKVARQGGALVKVDELVRPEPIPEGERVVDPDADRGAAVWPIERGMETGADEARRVWVDGIDRKAAKAAIDAQAEELRLRLLTAGAGMALVYESKRTEAVKASGVVAGGGTPAEADFPLLAAEIGITGDDVADVATAVLETAARWTLAAAAIEAARLAAKRAVEAAETVEAFDAAQAVMWPEILEE